MNEMHLIKRALERVCSYINPDTDLRQDLGLNIWGISKVGMNIECILEEKGFRRITDEEIKSWQTVSDILKTIETIKAEGHVKKNDGHASKK